MQRFKSYHASASIECLYLKQLSVDRGLKNLYHAWEREVVSMGLYQVSEATASSGETLVISYQ